MVQQKIPLFTYTQKQLVAILILAIAYYGTAEIARNLASTPQSVTPVWPPDGLAVGAVLLFGNWIGYGVFLGSFLANFWAFRDATNILSIITSSIPVIGIAIGTTLGTLIGAFLLRRSTKYRYPLERITDVFKFLFLTGAIAPIINATVGVLCLVLSNKLAWTSYSSVWLTWWISNISGIFIVTPILLSCGRWLQTNHYPNLPWLFIEPDRDIDSPIMPPSAKRLWFLRFKAIIEPLILLILVILIGKIAFGDGYHLEYLLIPILLWATFRLGQFGATLLTFVVAAIAVVATVNGKGAFATLDINQSLMQLQSFIGVITFTILILTATISERTNAEMKLRLAFAELARSNENLEFRVQERTEELHKKNSTLNQTLQTLKQTQLQMFQSEKMSALGQMVAGIAHEINNPVSFIHGNLSHVSEYIQGLLTALKVYQKYYPHPPASLDTELADLELDFLQEDLSKMLQSMKMGTDRIRAIVLSLRSFSRLDEAELKTVDIHQGIDSALVILQHRLNATEKRPAIQVLKDYGTLPLIECDAGSLNQVFMNLLTNAIDALEASNQGYSFPEISNKPNTIWIHSRQIDNNQIAIAISDNGIGIPEEIRSKIFDPFFTTKTVGKGTGLGLAISYQIVTERHGGKIWFDSNESQGSKFLIQIPVKNPRF